MLGASESVVWFKYYQGRCTTEKSKHNCKHDLGKRHELWWYHPWNVWKGKCIVNKSNHDRKKIQKSFYEMSYWYISKVWRRSGLLLFFGYYWYGLAPIHTLTYINNHPSTYTHTYTHTHRPRTSIITNTNTHIQLQICTHKLTHISMRMYALISTYAHTYTNTCTPSHTWHPQTPTHICHV